MNEVFNIEFKRRLSYLQRRIEQYNDGEVTENSVLSALFSCASYCWCKRPVKKVKK